MSPDGDTRIRQEDLEEYLPEVYTEYAMSVISDRAIPDVRDGLKPVQRRILYSMWEQGLTPDKPHKKSARTVGEVLGKYHPHGDQAVYQTLVRLGQDFVMRHPLIDGQGNFGSIDGDPPAAMRYTEARLTPLATEFFERLQSDGSGVPWQRNFDGSTREPEVLPVPYPNLLVNGASGIAVGMSTDIPPHNLSEILEASIHMADLKNPDQVHWDTLLEIIEGPDFPTGGKIHVDREALEELYRTGEGHFEIAGRCHSEEISPKRSAVVIEELPYGVSKSKVIDEIVDLAQSDEDPGISTVRDESDRQGLRIVVECRLNRSDEIVLNNLYEKTSLKSRQRCAFLALDDGVPRTLNLREMLARFLEFMDEVLVRNTRRRRDEAEDRLHIVRGLLKALVDIDRVIEIVKQSDTPARASEALQHEFEMSEEQAEAVLDRRIRSLTGLQQMEIEREKKQLLEDLDRYETLLDSPEERADVIKGWFREVRDEYAQDRRTDVVHEELKLDVEDLRASEPAVLAWYPDGYLRRDRGDRSLEELPVPPRQFLSADTLEEWVLFDANGQAYTFRVSEVPDDPRDERGVPLQQINSHVDEVVGMVPNDTPAVLVLTRGGYVKRMAVDGEDDFESIRPSGVKYTRLEEGDRVASVVPWEPDRDLVVVSEDGRGIRFDPEELRPMSRQARGVTAKKGSSVVGGGLVEDGDFLLLQGESTRGAVRAGDLDPQKRGGKGRYLLKPGQSDRLTAVQVTSDPRACRDGELIEFTSRSKLGGGGARQAIDHFVVQPRWNRDEPSD